MPQMMRCRMCGELVESHLYWYHYAPCLQARSRARAEQAALMEQTESTYYGNPVELSDIQLANNRENIAVPEPREWVITEQEKEALTRFAATSPEFNDPERRV
jgi:hypothetical protein